MCERDEDRKERATASPRLFRLNIFLEIVRIRRAAWVQVDRRQYSTCYMRRANSRVPT